MNVTSARAVAMAAGATLPGTRITQEVAQSFSGPATVLDIAQALAAHYEATRSATIEQQVLTPRGLNWQTFYGGHASFNPQITMMLDQAMLNFNFGVELLLAGVDDSGGHIYSVQNPGKPELLHDVIGYAAIGSGAIHAVQSMIGFAHTAHAGYHETVFRVYASKRRAEAAPGVGLDTDMVVISAAGIHWLTDEELDQLRTIYEEFQATTTAALTKRLAKFKLGEATDDHSPGNGEEAREGDGK